jgi:hypothetical protein
MFADQLDYIVGVDPHRDSHALAIVHVLSGAVVFESTAEATAVRLVMSGYTLRVGARSLSRGAARSVPV